MSPGVFLIASTVIFAGSVVQGSIGFGANLVAGPILIMIERSLVPGPILVTAWALTASMWWRERGSTDVRGVRWGLLGRVPGAALGAICVAVLPAEGLEVSLGTVILLAVGVSTTNVRVVPTRSTVWAAGLLSGFFTSTAAVGGPPAALVYQSMPGPVVRSTIAALATTGGLSAGVFLALAGELGPTEILHGALLLPALFSGLWASRRLAHWLDNGYTRHAILLLCGVSGFAVLIRGLV